MSTNEWKKENTMMIMLRVTKNSGIPEALQKAKDKTGENASAYARKALIDRLILEGYLKQEE